MFTTILGLVTGLGGPLIGLGNKLVDLQRDKAQAKSNVELKTIDAEILAIQDRRAVLIAEAGSRLAGGLNACMRFLLALGPLLVILKLEAWDKVIGSFYGCSGPQAEALDCYMFRTDPLDANQWAVITAVIGFYFLSHTLNGIFKK